jgi:hypothetical protein
MPLALLLAAAIDAHAQGGRWRGPSHLVGAGTTAAIRIDGVLNEAVWQSADSITSLTQVEPTQGAASSARTVIRVLATADAIVIGVRAEYPPGVSIVSYARNRDATLDSEIHQGRDRYVSRWAIGIRVRRERQRRAVRRAGVGQAIRRTRWDAIWAAATNRTENGWTAEIRIPIKSLLFRPGLTEWGLNIQRRIQRLQETDRWASALRDLKVTQMSRAGALTGMPPFSLGMGLSIRPSVAGGAARDSAGALVRNRNHTSLDVTQRLGMVDVSWWPLTVNTDFAETRSTCEPHGSRSSSREANVLSQAPISSTSGSARGRRDSILQSTHRSVLGHRVPLDAGLKVNGRAAGASYGALVARTGEADTLTTEGGMGVVRMKRNVLGESSVGFIATAGDPIGRSGAWLAGPDITYQTSRFRAIEFAHRRVGTGVGRKTSREIGAPSGEGGLSQ